MTDKVDWARENDMVFHAVCQDLGASWARDIDPITAIRAAHSYHGSHSKTCIAVMYGNRHSMNTNEWGGWTWELDGFDDPIPVGLYLVTQRSIKPIEPEHYPDGKGESNREWIERTLRNIRKSREHFERKQEAS